MALFVPQSGEVALLGKLLYGSGGAIASSTNASPIVVTTTVNHGLNPSDRIIISNHTVNTAANQTWVLSAASGNQMTLTGSTGNGVGGATGWWSLADVEAGLLNLMIVPAPAPAENAGGGTYTPASFTGYNNKILNGRLSTDAGWTFPATAAAGGTGSWTPNLAFVPAEAQQPQITWQVDHNYNTSQSIAGYFVVGNNNGNPLSGATLWWVELFATPKSLGHDDTLQLTPRLGICHT